MKIKAVSLRLPIITLLTLILSACGGDDSGGSSSSDSFAVDGGGTKGPMAHSEVMAYAFDSSNENFQGRSLQKKMGRTNDAAALTDLSLTADDKDETPIILTVASNDDTIDLTTGLKPQAPADITALRTVITEETFALVEDGDQPMYATPLTTVAVELAITRAGQDASKEQFETALQSAAGDVVDAFGFGMSSTIDIFLAAPVVNRHITGLSSQAAVAEYRTAIETLGAIVQELYTTAKANNPQSVVTSDQILMALGIDLADGILNGLNGVTPIAALQDIPDIAAVLAVDLAQLHVPGREDVPLADVERLLVEEMTLTGVTGVDVSYLQESIDVVPTNTMLAFILDGEAHIISDGEESSGDASNSVTDSSGAASFVDSTVEERQIAQASTEADNTNTVDDNDGSETSSDSNTPAASNSLSATASQPESEDPVVNEDPVVTAANDPITVNGGGIKGPMLYAAVKVYAFSGKVIDRNAATNAAAEFTGIDLNLDDKKHTPLTLTVEADEDTIDITTGKTPLAPANITMLRTAITAAAFASIEEYGRKIYATPLTTVAVKLADAMPGSGASAQAYDAALQAAGRVVVEKLGFGMSSSVDVFLAPPLINSDTSSLEKLTAVVDYRTAVEALGAIVQELYEEAKDNNPGVTSDQILEALGEDLADDFFDGKNGATAISALQGISDITGAFAVDLSQLHVPGTDVPLTDVKTILLEEMLITGVTGIDVSYLEEDSTDKPRVVSAISTGNTKVLITFNKPMEKASAEVSSHYSIVQANVNAEVGALLVRQAELVGVDGRAVELTTSPQNEVTYTIMVTNVRDRSGNQIDIARALNNFVLANSADFAGTPPTSTPHMVCQGASNSNFNGLSCTTDADCGGDTGSCDLSGDFIDSDVDGISDDKEVRGYTIAITSSSGLVEEREVTSDPYNPDTDGDGVGDYDEVQYGSNPRDADTDGDTLDDNLELNTLFSSPYQVDSDGDGLEDGWEYNDFHTSVVLADTDGDQLTDYEEIIERHRNPRIADLPDLKITVGDMRLQIDERYTYTNEEGETVSHESSSNVTLASSSSTSWSNTHGDVTEIAGGLDIRAGLGSGNFFGGGTNGFSGGIEFTGHVSRSDTHTNLTTDESASEAQRVYENSLTKGREFTTTSSVTREVFGASIDVDLTVANAGDLAFRVTNIEVTVLQRSPIDTRRFIPVATLVSNSELATGTPLELNLGPFTTERGPLLFGSREVFPSLVEQLMRSPSGLIFRVANFDITDEFGRNFSFSNQIARDRTAGVTIDYGDAEAAEQFQLATNGAVDVNDYAGGGGAQHVGGFLSDGDARGMSLDYLLQEVLGLKKNDETTDGIVAGPDQTADSKAVGDDIQVTPEGTTGLSIGTIVIAAGVNGELDTPVAKGDGGSELDLKQFITGYETRFSCSFGADKEGDICAEHADCQCQTDDDDPRCDPLPDEESAAPSGLCGEKLVRINTMRNGDNNRTWVALTNAHVPAAADFGKIVVHPGEDVLLAFLQDLDEDGLFAREEFIAGSIDSRRDEYDNSRFGSSFGDDRCGNAVPCVVVQCGDNLVAETEAVDPDIQLLPVGSLCENADDTVVKAFEGNPLKATPNNAEVIDVFLKDGDGIADSRDTDRDGIGDFAEVLSGWKVSADGGVLRMVYSSPRLRDSDGDGLSDPQERDLRIFCEPTDPRQDALCAFQDDDPVAQEDAVAIIAGPDGKISSIVPEKVDENHEPVVDENGVPLLVDEQLVHPDDGIEGLAYAHVGILPGADGIIDTPLHPDDRYLSLNSVPPATDPSMRDTDRDGVNDGQELHGYDVGLAIVDGGNGIYESTKIRDDIGYALNGNPVIKKGIVLLPGLNGFIDSEEGGDDELRLAFEVVTDPLRRDTDDDTIADGRELLIGSNPTKQDDDAFRDSDRDGLTDAEESDLGWLVSVNGGTGYEVFPSPSLPDTDNDGLPDFVERDIKSDPNRIDTDGDGLSDFDEFAEFEKYVALTAQFAGIELNGTDSMRYGTKLDNQHSDEDTLTDYQELIECYLMTPPGATSPSRICTSPLLADTDLDGANDDDEANRDPKTDATNNDTDGDGKLDGVEIAGASDPLVPDIVATIRVQRIIASGIEGDGANNVGEMTWWLTTQGPRDTSPHLLTSPHSNYVSNDQLLTYIWDYGWADNSTNQCYEKLMGNGVSYNLTVKNSARSIVLKPGQSFALNGLIAEIDGVSADCGHAPNYIPTQIDDHQGPCEVFINELFTFEDLKNSTDQVRKIEANKHCTFDIQYVIDVQ